MDYNKLLTEEEKLKIRQDYIDNGLSILKVADKYGIKSKTFIQKFLGDDIRSASEALKLAHIKYPNKFKHTETTKEKMRKSRLAFIKDNPERTAWHNKNESQLEKIFEEYLIERGYNKHFLIAREYSVGAYRIDFAFLDQKIAIELDGTQHISRQKKDAEKDSVLVKNGWLVIRIPEKIIRSGENQIDNIINTYIDEDNIIFGPKGIVRIKKIRLKPIRDVDGLTKKQKDSFLRQRKVKNRPSKEELANLTRGLTFVNIGNIFGVTDNCIRKWCKQYGIPYRKQDIETTNLP